MHGLFAQADILHHITLESDPKDWPGLARVSRSFFSFAAPLIWRDVEGVHNLLALLPGVEITLSDPILKRVKHMEIRDQGSRDLTRFHIYAPFVRSLEIYGEDVEEYKITNRKALAQCAKDTPFLPNLVRLTLTSLFAITGQSQLFWIRTFLSPSLLEILVVGKPIEELPLIQMSLVPSLLQHISEFAPKTQQLSLFIEHNEFSRPRKYFEILASLRSHFKTLGSLRQLTSTDAVITPSVLPVIASLANLEVLNINRPYDGSDICGSVDPKSLPPNPFPALKHFSLCGADAGEAWSVLEYSIFSNLSSLRLEFRHYPTPDELGHGNMTPWEYQLVDLITRTCPHLTDLHLNFDENGNSVGNLRSPSNVGSALQLMTNLPLRVVCIASAHFGLVGDSDVVTRDELEIAWPLVTKLSMPHLEAHFKLLYEFSQLPNLQELTLRLYLEDESIDGNFFEQPTGSLSLRTLWGSGSMFFVEAEAKLAARVLLHCWPNLECVEIDPRDNLWEYHDEEDAGTMEQQLDEINQEIRFLRESRSNSTSDLP
ncbi:hypothetical protein FRC08_008924 [Ceratobasidium sp. 394]|nr:hypothetical protein FRC08_008924 [Ceratobasidium sp. 394]KAG9093657.1 hypothetical protein FS749_013993 [Ceratobasidium sp. UAMH 11750]